MVVSPGDLNGLSGCSLCGRLTPLVEVYSNKTVYFVLAPSVYVIGFAVLFLNFILFVLVGD